MNERDKIDPDGVIARLAARQHGVITFAQLLSAGPSRATIANRVRAGRLHRIHRGVYAVGHTRLSDEGRWMAAVLACGEGAVLSHESAAQLWGIRRHRRRPEAVHVTVPGTGGRRRRAGIAVHRSATLTDADCTRVEGIPVTAPARTISDLRPRLSPAQFAAALREADFLRLPVAESAVRSGTKPAHVGSSSTRARSELEWRMLAICRRHRLPRPDVNVKVDRYEVDFLWRPRALIVEVDGWEAHRSRSAFEADRARDVQLELIGYRVLRFTWRQVDGDPQGVARSIRTLLLRR